MGEAVSVKREEIYVLLASEMLLGGLRLEPRNANGYPFS
jgi:hypothetical protein